MRSTSMVTRGFSRYLLHSETGCCYLDGGASQIGSNRPSSATKLSRPFIIKVIKHLRTRTHTRSFQNVAIKRSFEKGERSASLIA